MAHKTNKRNINSKFGNDGKSRQIMSENLPKKWNLFNQAHEYAKSYNYKYCWCASGNIYLRKNDWVSPTVVNSKADLEKLKNADLLDTSLLTFEGCFEQQVEKILGAICLTQRDVDNLQSLLEDLTNALFYIWPGCRVYPFGSVVTGLAIKTSDLDCYVDLPPEYTVQNPVIRVRNLLKQDTSRFTKIFAITRARVPILKFVHVPTGFSCDVNFSNLNGVRNSKLIKFLLGLDSRAWRLTVILKYWSKVYNFTGTNYLPNYALVLMVIFYLQVKSVLPSVLKLQQHTPGQWVNVWNTAFNDEFVHTADNTESLYELLGGFFEFYKNFNYAQFVISPFLGRPVKKEQLKDTRALSLGFRLYLHNVLGQKCTLIRSDTAICIQDPFDHSRNCAVAVAPKLLNIILGHITIVHRMFYEMPRSGFLSKLFTHKLVYEPIESTQCSRLVCESAESTLPMQRKPNNTWDVSDIEEELNRLYNVQGTSNTTPARWRGTAQMGYQYDRRFTAYPNQTVNSKPFTSENNESGLYFWLFVICCFFVWLQSQK